MSGGIKNETNMGCQHAASDYDKAVTGDKLVIADGYKQKLADMNLSEVAALPYFTSPFITIAKNAKGEQYAVVFPSAGNAYVVLLPLSYEEMIRRFRYPITIPK